MTNFKIQITNQIQIKNDKENVVCFF